MSKPDTIEKERTELVIYKSDNNLDKLDNLDELPAKPAVYSLGGRINGQHTNSRIVGSTENLQDTIKVHFSVEEPDACLKQFMQSIKIKSLVYLLLDDIKEAKAIEKEWKSKFNPDCNEELNKVH